MPKSKLLPSLFAPLLFFKDRRERLALGKERANRYFAHKKRAIHTKTKERFHNPAILARVRIIVGTIFKQYYYFLSFLEVKYFAVCQHSQRLWGHDVRVVNDYADIHGSVVNNCSNTKSA